MDSTISAFEKDCWKLFERTESNHIVLLLPLCFWKLGECWILNDVMVQLWIIWFTVFKWTKWFNRTIRVGTMLLCQKYQCLSPKNVLPVCRHQTCLCFKYRYLEPWKMCYQYIVNEFVCSLSIYRFEYQYFKF